MKLFATIVMAALAGCSGSGPGGSGPGGGADGGGGTGGGGGSPIPCTLNISGDVTLGTYHQCNVFAAPQGLNSKVQVDGLVLTGCDGCSVIADFSQTPTDRCSTGGATLQVIDPSLWPDAIGMAATSTDSMASCTITTSQLDLTGNHWSGSIEAFLVATDFNFNTVGFAHVTLTGGF
jgi:hypothetical protein